MHLKVSHNVKTLLSARHRNTSTLRKPFRKPSNQDALHLLLQHNADLGSHLAAKSFEAHKHVRRRNPAGRTRGFKAAFAKPNGLIMFPVWLPQWLRRWWKPPRYDFRESSIIIRLATDPVRQHEGADIICEREVERSVCGRICVLITLVHPCVGFHFVSFIFY